MLHSRIEGHGKTLLIIHGFLGMSDNWKSLGLLYAKEGFECHLLDMRNHGKSFHSDDFSYEFMVQDVLDYCMNHKIEICSIIGHSMGGKVAMLFACRFPEMVDKLIIADIGPKYYAPHHQEILDGLNAIDFSKKPNRTEVEVSLFPYIPDFGTRQFLLKNLYWKTPDELAFRFNLEIFNKKIEEIGKALPKDKVFQKEALFIRGGNSNYILESDLDEIKNHFPKFKIITIPNVGHWLHAENPNMFFEETINYLK